MPVCNDRAPFLSSQAMLFHLLEKYLQLKYRKVNSTLDYLITFCNFYLNLFMF